MESGSAGLAPSGFVAHFSHVPSGPGRIESSPSRAGRLRISIFGIAMLVMPLHGKRRRGRTLRLGSRPSPLRRHYRRLRHLGAAHRRPNRSPSLPPGAIPPLRPAHRYRVSTFLRAGPCAAGGRISGQYQVFLTRQAAKIITKNKSATSDQSQYFPSCGSFAKSLPS
jgi:hypothetical protein